MTNEPACPEESRLTAGLRKLTASALQVARGDYAAAKDLFQATLPDSATPELNELAETLGLMSVKVEAREFRLEQLNAELRRKNAEIERATALRAESGFLFCSIVLLLGIYAITLSALLFAGRMTDTTERVMTVGLLAAMSAFVGVVAKRRRQPWSAWGLTWRGGWRSLRESLLFSIPVALAGIALKAALVRWPGSPWFGHPLFEGFCPLPVMSLYALGAAVQEIVNRGFLQTSIERMLTGRHRAATAIATASLLFAVAHLHYAIPTMAATLLGGLFFGWLFHRHRTLVGVIVVHFLLGVLLLDLLRLIG